MSDFYQILKREISPHQQPAAGAVELSKESGAETEAVDKVDNPLPAAKKKGNEKKSNRKSKKVFRKKNSRLPLSAKPANTDSFLSLQATNPIWLTMSETAKLGGIQKRTVKRALRAGFIKYQIVESRYQVDLRSALLYLFSKKKLWNKLKELGIGQYIEKWRN